MQVLISFALLISTILAKEDGSTRNSLRRREGRIRSSSKSPDPVQIFNILTSNNDIIAGDLREAVPYRMPYNLEVCKESFAMESNSPEYLTNPPPSLPEINVQNGTYSYAQYKEDSAYAREMDRTVERADNLFTQLYDSGFISLLGDNPSLMWDIDNTMAYTAYNDTDDVGDAPPIEAVADLARKWCRGWGSGEKAIMNCVFITARYCTEMNAKATHRWLKKTYPEATDELIHTNVQFSGNLSCSCCDQGNIAYKDILRKDWTDQIGAHWVASIGDQYTDSVGRYSGIRIKLPNVWFDSSIVPNQFTLGASRPATGESISPEDWSTSCSTQERAPLVPGPVSCIDEKALMTARAHASFEHCLAQTTNIVENQLLGCTVDISSGMQTCH